MRSTLTATTALTPRTLRSAWSVFGAVNRVTVLHFNTLAYMDEWRATIKGLRALGAQHSTPHAEALRMLEAL